METPVFYLDRSINPREFRDEDITATVKRFCYGSRHDEWEIFPSNLTWSKGQLEIRFQGKHYKIHSLKDVPYTTIIFKES